MPGLNVAFPTVSCVLYTPGKYVFPLGAGWVPVAQSPAGGGNAANGSPIGELYWLHGDEVPEHVPGDRTPIPPVAAKSMDPWKSTAGQPPLGLGPTETVVVADERRPIGIVTHSDLRDRAQSVPAARLMSQRLITLRAGIANRDAFLQMDEARVKAAPVLDDAGRLLGVLTRNDAVRLELLRPGQRFSESRPAGTHR